MRKTVEDRESIKILIEQKALEIFSYKGYSATRMDDIAEAAGISRGPLYYHYNNKAQLYNYVAECYLSNQFIKYKNIFEQEDTSIFDKIHMDLTCCTDGAVHRFFINSYLHEELSYAKDKYTEFLNNIYQVKFNKINKSIEEGYLINGADAKVITDMIYVFYYGICKTSTDEFFKINISIEENEKLIELFIEGLKIKYEKR